MGDPKGDVVFIRWPAQQELRTQCQQQNVPRLLVVEAGAQPPVSDEPDEDWVRPPVSRDDLETRVATLRNRFRDRQVPVLDLAGTLTIGERSITVPPMQTGMVQLLVERFGEVVYRNELANCLARPSAAPGQEVALAPNRNSVDLHIMRLRRRLETVGLSIQTAWGQGYQLERSSPG